MESGEGQGRLFRRASHRRRDGPASAVHDTENFPAHCRLSAEKCRRRADAAVGEVSKTTWRVFAEEWMKLADEAEHADPGAPKKTAGPSSAKSS